MPNGINVAACLAGFGLMELITVTVWAVLYAFVFLRRMLAVSQP